MNTLEEATTDIVKATAKITETMIKKAWTIAEAAVEKKAPSEYLSQQGIQAIQGKTPTGRGK
jgi:hypothetical protein